MLSGSIVALVTPFREDGSIDFDAMERLIEFQIANGTDGILVMGTTGESSTTTHEEDFQIFNFARKVINGRVKMLASGSSNSTQTQLEKCRRFTAAGVDGLLCIAPYYNKANEEGMYRHFATVADEIEIPMILYNVPSRTGSSISPSVVGRLAKHEMIQGIKEASGNFDYIMKIAGYLSDDFVMFSGNDNIVVPMMSVGAKGVISVWANIQPKECSEMVHAYLNGEHEKAAQMQLHYLKLINALFCEVNPIPVKAALKMMGLIGSGHLRLPLYDLAENHRTELEGILKEYELI